MALDADQVRNANTIIRVGRSLGASDRDVTIALMTALQESGLRNLDHGDRDSVGLFQQRGPWGSFEERTNPIESAKMFFKGGKGGQPGLFSKRGRSQMSLTQAAQSVQVSAFPNAYAKHQGLAEQLLAGAGGTPGPSGAASTSTSAPGISGVASKVAAASPLNMAPSSIPDPVKSPGIVMDGAAPSDSDATLDPAALGARSLDLGRGLDTGRKLAGNLAGDEPTGVALSDAAVSPSLPKVTQDEFASVMGGVKLPGPYSGEPAPAGASGVRKRVIDEAMTWMGTPYVWGGTSKSGVDCSGYVQAVFAKFGVNLPRISFQQATYGKRLNQSQAQPGDLYAEDNSPRNHGADHIAIYLGNGWIAEAPHPGARVIKRKLSGKEQNGWYVSMQGVLGAK